ncbi:hypothetical protein BH11VER1_BH11VER1_07260 [soil metagenome]
MHFSRTFFILFLTVATTYARPQIKAVHTDTAPVIDGKLDDACWAKAQALTDFHQKEPIQGAAATERTEVRFLFDEGHLYIAARCFDQDPGKIVVRELAHDTLLKSDDNFKIALDTFNRQREGYLFMVNPAGAYSEGIYGRLSEWNLNWDTIWKVRCNIDEEGWTVEMSIPTKSLGFDPASESWGVNVERVIRHKQEYVRWQAVDPAKQMTALEDFGELEGLVNLKQGSGLELRPYVSGKYADGDFDLKTGFDLTWHPTPDLSTTLTVNTDFAEADVDARAVNLTRFPLFFPEKRDFFLQDAPLFVFGGLNNNNRPFYSRRVGLGADGQPADILYGVKVSGHIEGTSVAILDVQQAEHAGIDEKNLAILRISQQVSQEWSVGTIFTSGDPRQNTEAWLLGADINYLSSEVFSNKLLTGNAFFMGASSGTKGDDLAYGMNIKFPNEPLDVRVAFRQWGEDFYPALGFLQRTAAREYNTEMEYTWRPNTSWLRRISLSAETDIKTDLDGTLVEDGFDLPFVSLETPSKDIMSFGFSHEYDLVDESFTIGPDVPIAVGEYGWNKFTTHLTTNESRPVATDWTFSTGDYYDGTQTRAAVDVEWSPNRFFGVGMEYDWRSITVSDTAFEVQLVSASLSLAWSPELRWRTLIQYDNISHDVGVNSRIRWTYRPGSDLFLVFNQGWIYDEKRFTKVNTVLNVKAGLTWRF